jgi:hypothetical protein
MFQKLEYFLVSLGLHAIWLLLLLLLQVQGQLAEVAAAFLAKVQPKGAGALSFGLSQGKLVLLGAQMGKALALSHCCLLCKCLSFYAPWVQHCHIAVGEGASFKLPERPALSV